MSEYKEVVIKCACGKTWNTSSTKGDMRVEICSACHPYFTGGATGATKGKRADRFKKKYNYNN